jgi:hypothetical protein
MTTCQIEAMSFLWFGVTLRERLFFRAAGIDIWAKES